MQRKIKKNNQNINAKIRRKIKQTPFGLPSK
jgi:hypothetical protein